MSLLNETHGDIYGETVASWNGGLIAKPIKQLKILRVRYCASPTKLE